METVFINPNPGGSGINEATIIPPLGLCYMAAMLEKHSFPCSIIDAYVNNLDAQKVCDHVSKRAAVVGVYVNSFTYNAALEIVRGVKERLPKALIILGGPVPTGCPDMVMEDFPCDAVIQGEGEYAVLKLVQNLSTGREPFAEVSGAVYRAPDGKTLLRNPIERIKDLDALPFPALHLLPPLKRYRSRAIKPPAVPIITSRGCVFDCTFCAKDVFAKRVTFRSPENVLEEIRVLIDTYGVRQIDIMDDNFAVNRKRMEAILDGIIERFPGLVINTQAGIRSELLDESILAKMKRAGVTKLAFGIETADPDVLRLCRKKSSLDKIAQSVKLAKKMGFAVFGFFIVGLPGETEAGFQKTLDYARSLDLDIANFCMATPFVGTELYRQVQEKGRFLIDTRRNIDTGFYGGKVFYEYEGMTADQVLDRYRRAYREFYTFRKKVKMVLGIRSWGEARWLFDAAVFVMKGLFRATFDKFKSRGAKSPA